jgi:FkbM family methyltransferase
MPPLRRVAGVLANRSVPVRTRRSLLVAEVRRRVARKPCYRIRFPSADLFVTHDDFEVDWETLKSVLADEIYETDHRGAVVLDIGAHKGYYGAYALARGARHVISFEPEPVNAGYVLQSIASAGGASWLMEEAAVGASAGEAELHVMGASWGHALEPPESWAEFEVGLRSVPVVSFRDALARATRDGTSPVVVKLNIEGAECGLILGTPVETWREVDEVIVATHPWAPCGDDLVRHLGEAGLSPSPSAHPRMLRLRREAHPRADPRSAAR